MKWISRNESIAFLFCLSIGWAVPAIAQDETNGPSSSIQYFEPVVDVSSSASASTSAPRRATSSGRFNLSFRTLGRSFDVELEPNDLFVEGAKTTWIDDSGVVEMEPQPIFYRGRMRNEADSWVRMTLQGGTLEGMVWTPDETYFFEPAVNLLGASAEGTVAYRLSDTESEWTEQSCGVEGNSLRHHQHRRRAKSSRTQNALQSLRAALQATSPATALDRLQLGIVGDWELFGRHGGASDTHMQTIVNLMDGVYQREINVKVEIMNTIVYSTSNDPFSDTTNPSTRLNEFGSYRNANDNSPGQLLYGADLAHLFTGVDLSGSTVGIAWVGSVCETITGAGVSQDYSSNMNSLVSLTAHEIGHNLAARHDSDVGCTTGFIMWPSVLTVGDLENLHFSTCSKSSIAQEVASSSCMDDFVPGTPTNTPTRTPTPSPTRTPTPRPNVAEFVSQSIPTTMQAGQQYEVSVTMRNTGSNTWTPSTHGLGAQNPHDNTTWGMKRVMLDGGDNISTGEVKTFTWVVTAPTSAGNYNFQWWMLNFGVEWFGPKTPNVVVNVQGSALPGNAAEFVSQSVPTSMQAGEQYEVSITLRNTGSNTWTPSTYGLGAQNPHDNMTWGMKRVFLQVGESIDTNQLKTFTWTVTAPPSAGNYDFQWWMLHFGVEWFGPKTPNVVVTVQGAGLPGNAAEFVSQSVPTSMQAGQQYQVSVTMRNTGSNTWTSASHVLGAQNPHDNMIWGGRIPLAGGDSIGTNQTKTFSRTVTAPSTPGSYNFQWWMLNLGVAWFGDKSTNVVVDVQ